VIPWHRSGWKPAAKSMVWIRILVQDQDQDLVIVADKKRSSNDSRFVANQF